MTGGFEDTVGKRIWVLVTSCRITTVSMWLSMSRGLGLSESESEWESGRELIMRGVSIQTVVIVTN